MLGLVWTGWAWMGVSLDMARVEVFRTAQRLKASCRAVDGVVREGAPPKKKQHKQRRDDEGKCAAKGFRPHHRRAGFNQIDGHDTSSCPVM